MPKTKLGTEIKNYGRKRLKSGLSCSLTPSLESEDVKTFVKETLASGDKVSKQKLEDVLVTTAPFNCVVIENFLHSPEFLGQLQQECDGLKLRQKNNDLYKFQQSAALDSGTPGAPCLQQLRARLLDTVRVWVAGVLGLDLEPDTLDLFCAKYRHTDTLLCHDDELEGRKVAFILYLSEDTWTEADGGLLQLFDTDSLGNPGSVAASLVPRPNSFALFEVSPVSFHAVSEVLSETKTRTSLSGWFHGKSPARPPRQPPPLVPCLASAEVEEEAFFSWLNPAYLDPETQGEIQSQFEESSEISLSRFLCPEVYSELSQALATHSKWTTVGPPDRKCCQVLEGADDTQQQQQGVIHQCLRLFTSDAFFLLLSNLTGLRLHQLAPEDSDQEDEEEGGKEKVFNPRCRGGFCRWGRGNYTLIRDDDQEQAEYALDLRMFFNVSQLVSEAEEDGGGGPEAGGQTVYIARGEDEELVTVAPGENTLSLVYRDKDSLKFVKCVNSRLQGHFHDLALTYYE